MQDSEKEAMDVINALFDKEELPMDRLKSIDLHWDSVEGYYFPVLKSEFYEDKSVWKGVFGDE